MSPDELLKHRRLLYDKLSDEYHDQLWSGELDEKTLIGKSEFFIKHAEGRERLNQEFLAQQITQVQHARSISRVSPATLLQHLLESFAGTGFERHLQFLENVKTYARQLRQFVVDTDRADPQSLHIIGVREGMTKRKILPKAIPKFEDTFSFSKDLNTRAMELLLLALFVVVLLASAYLAFVRVEI